MEVYPLGPYLLCLATGIWWFCEFLSRDVLFFFLFYKDCRKIYVSHGTVCGIFSSYFMQQEVVSQESL